MTRTVAHAIRDGYIEVLTRAYSIPEALALEFALKSAPPSSAFGVPESGSLDALRIERSGTLEDRLAVSHWPDAPDESELPPQAFRDESDNAGELKHGEAVG